MHIIQPNNADTISITKDICQKRKGGWHNVKMNRSANQTFWFPEYCNNAKLIEVLSNYEIHIYVDHGHKSYLLLTINILKDKI